MAYLGKEFVVVKEENYDAFIKSMGLPEEMTQKYLQYKPTVKLSKVDDKYVWVSGSDGAQKEVQFQSGVEFDDEIRPGLVVKNKFVVDGDVVVQELTKDDKSCSFKREFLGDELKVTITASFFDGVAYRYYKAV